MSNMTLGQITTRVRAHTRDLSGTVFSNQHIHDFINEGINRVRMLVPELRGMAELAYDLDTVKLMPDSYQHLLALYAASRCYFQDDRFYQATTYMNEFEIKIDEMKNLLHSGNLAIVDDTGADVEFDYSCETVNLKPYWLVDADPEELPEGFDYPEE